MAFPVPPPDLSGGFMVIAYSDGTDAHRMRFHLDAFDPTNYNTGGVISGTDTDGLHNFAYTGPRPGGDEQGVNDTFNALVAKIKPYYSTAWQFSMAALYQIVAGKPVEVFPTPTPAAIAGTSANATMTGQGRALELIYSFKSSGGHRGRCIMIAQSAIGIDVPAVVTPSSGGAGGVEWALVGYLSGAATGVVCHDNNKFQAIARRTVCYNRRLRRHYGYA